MVKIFKCFYLAAMSQSGSIFFYKYRKLKYYNILIYMRTHSAMLCEIILLQILMMNENFTVCLAAFKSII